MKIIAIIPSYEMNPQDGNLQHFKQKRLLRLSLIWIQPYAMATHFLLIQFRKFRLAHTENCSGQHVW